jgi:hypothetical protein
LIDNKGNAIICYNVLLNKNLNICISFKNLEYSDAYWYNESLISNSNITTLYPTLISFNDLVYILWLEGSSIVYKISKNTLNKFSKKNISDVLTKNVIKANYSSNHPYDKHLKNSWTYISHNKFAFTVIPFESQFFEHNNNFNNVEENISSLSTNISKDLYDTSYIKIKNLKLQEFSNDLASKIDNTVENKINEYILILYLTNEKKLLESNTQSKIYELLEELNLNKNYIKILEKIIYNQQKIISRLSSKNKKLKNKK